MGIIPIASSRVSDQLVRQRLLSQLNSDQSSLLKIEEQISTGRRIGLPSEDAPAALRGITLQSLLERKSQVKTNITTNQSYLSASDSALGNVSSLLTSVRGSALGVIDSGSNDNQRAAAAEEVHRAIQQLVDAGNQQFRGRYLFAGSQTTVRPFDDLNGYVKYNGNEQQLNSYADVDLLFSSNVNGNSVFGGLSQQVRGAVDLNPVLNESTHVSDLHLGQGIALGSVLISDGVHSSVVDLSKASTLGDVAALLEAHPPGAAEGAPRTLTASVTSTGLTVFLDAAGGGALTIREVGGGTTAKELGILHETGVGVGPVVGDDLNPRITKGTKLADLIGTRPGGVVASTSQNNDLKFEALSNGTQFNGVVVQFADNPLVVKGSETVLYDSNAKTLTFQIDDGNTTAGDIVRALRADPSVNTLFAAATVRSDTTSSISAGNGVVDPAATVTLSGGLGANLDLTNGIKITNGGQTYAINLSSVQSVEDLLNTLNGSAAGVLAALNAAGDGIDVRSRISGGDFSISENGGLTATQLGLRTFTASTELAALNFGAGVHASANADFAVDKPSGGSFNIATAGAKTVQDVIDLINNHVDNQDPATKVTAQLATSGNGIELTTADAGATTTFKVRALNSSQAALDLGLIPQGASQSAAPIISGGTKTITGRDVNPSEVAGTFSALVRLEKALRANDIAGVQRAIGLLDDSNLQVNFARAELGARQQGLDTLSTRLDDEVTSLTDSLSKEVDTDVTSAISDLTARQTAFEATLRITAQISRLSILDYL